MLPTPQVKANGGSLRLRGGGPKGSGKSKKERDRTGVVDNRERKGREDTRSRGQNNESRTEDQYKSQMREYSEAGGTYPLDANTPWGLKEGKPVSWHKCRRDMNEPPFSLEVLLASPTPFPKRLSKSFGKRKRVSKVDGQPVMRPVVAGDVGLLTL